MKWKALWAIRQGCIRRFLVSVKRELLSQLLVPAFIRLTEAQPPHPESPHHSGSLPKQPWPPFSNLLLPGSPPLCSTLVPLTFLFKLCFSETLHIFSIHLSPNSSIAASLLLGTQSKAKRRERGWIFSWCLNTQHGCAHTTCPSPCQGSLCIISLL